MNSAQEVYLVVAQLNDRTLFLIIQFKPQYSTPKNLIAKNVVLLSMFC
jgi:hypothetical protein